MTCTNCGADVPPKQAHCGVCGFKMIPETLDDVRLRLSALEQKRTDQQFLDVDTTEKVVTRLMSWAKMFAFFVGIPIAVILLGLALFVGKSFKDLSYVASNARKSIQPILEQARVEAENARKTATEALIKSQEVNRTIGSTKTSLSELNKQVSKRSADVEQLSGQLRRSQADVSALQAQVAQGSTDVTRLKQQIQVASTEKNAVSIEEAYPAFGTRVVGWRDGYIDSAKKKPGDVYLSLALAVRPDSTSGLEANKLAQVMSLLKAQNFEVFFGGVSLLTVSSGPGHSTQGLSGLDESSCRLGGTGLVPPCILYFRQDMKPTVANLKTLLGAAQVVPDDKIRYADPQKLGPLIHELIEKAGLDVHVVLGSR